MDLTLNESERMLRDGIAKTLAAEVTSDIIRASEGGRADLRHRLWERLAALGYFGLALPSGIGGTGVGFVELVLMIEQSGRAMVPGPIVGTTLVSLFLQECGGFEDEIRSLIDGSAIGTIAWSEADTDEHSSMRLTAGQSGRINGRKLGVPFGTEASIVAVFGRTSTGGPAVFLTKLPAEGVTVRSISSIAGEPAADIEFKDAPSLLLSDDCDRLDRWRQLLLTAEAALGVGLCTRLSELSLEYAKTRVQFGRAIGSFQAIQHRCVDMALKTQGARLLTYQAAARLARGQGAEFQAAAAQAYTASALAKLSRHAHQIHGAIGFSAEYDLQLVTRRSKAQQLRMGGASVQMERVAREMGARIE